eukprot:1158148-Pelagomonas_calceolata.AAC.1
MQWQKAAAAAAAAAEEGGKGREGVHTFVETLPSLRVVHRSTKTPTLAVAQNGSPMVGPTISVTM